MAKYTLTVTDATADEIAALLAPRRMAGALGAISVPVDNYIHDEHGPCQPLQGDAPPQPDAQADTDDDGTTNADAPDTDKRGYPWDERIHASSKALNKDETWRYRRNTPQETIDAVEAEIKAPTNDGHTVPALTPAVDEDPLAIPPFLQRSPAPVVVDVPAPAVVTYEQVIAELTAAMKQGKIAPEALSGFYKACGVDDVNGLVGNQDALNKAHERIAGL